MSQRSIFLPFQGLAEGCDEMSGDRAAGVDEHR
ncbi:hypothetical protein PCA20602_01258 [Pandoraea capi]|uniref:Uncharacterized protein n=1 Tax=Pandoraea capi TaxID=2508286 RepID=A0ABY6VUY0_9BURK|nr:hypothetical protein PCA20602_01258 [Pandoraea capi]